MLSKCFFRCLHDEISSFLEFNVAISGWRIIKSFSCKHRLHLFVLPEYALQRFMIYEDTGDVQTYVGITEGSFKSRYNNHTSTFRNPKRKHSTALSRYIWNLKDTNANFSLKWKIMKRCKAYSGRTKRCSLCLHEKLFIIRHPEMATLNSRNELISSCRHRKKHLLSTH